MFLKSFLIELPSSKSLSLGWNFGRILGFILLIQTFRGLFLSFYYVADGIIAFNSVQYIMYEVNYGWVFRCFHLNGARLFFIFLFLHLFKALFYYSYRLVLVWYSGLFIFILLIIEAFMGYVLVWGQIRFWASVVITSLLRVIPFWGPSLVFWIWSGYSVVSATLKFIFILHFMLPWVLFLFVLFHLFALHHTGSTSLLFCHGDYDKLCFIPFYWLKDFYNFMIFVIFMIIVFIYPFDIGDPEMFIECDSLVSPSHIVPEWYFLYAYAILRSIPDKVIGIIALFIRLLVFFIFGKYSRYLTAMDKVNKFLVYVFIFNCVLLSWLGQCLVEEPYILIRFVCFLFYFVIIFFMIFVNVWFYKLFGFVFSIIKIY